MWKHTAMRNHVLKKLWSMEEKSHCDPDHPSCSSLFLLIYVLMFAWEVLSRSVSNKQTNWSHVFVDALGRNAALLASVFLIQNLRSSICMTAFFLQKAWPMIRSSLKKCSAGQTQLLETLPQGLPSISFNKLTPLTSAAPACSFSPGWHGHVSMLRVPSDMPRHK